MPDSELSIGGLLERVRAGRDVAEEVPGDAGRALLDEAASALAGECRVVRVAAGAAALTLSGFMAQIAGGIDAAGSEDGVLELGYQRLAVPDVPGGKVALLVSGAGRLQRPVLKFIQHVAKAAPGLVLVMTGELGWRDVLEGTELAPLRARLTAEPPAFTPMVRRVETVERMRGGGGWALAGVGVVAGVLAGVWLGQQHWPGTQAVQDAPKAALEAAVGQPARAAQTAAPANRAEPPPAAAPTAEAPAATVVASAAVPPPALPSLRPAPEAPRRLLPHHAERRPRHASVRMVVRPQGGVREESVSPYTGEPPSGWGDPDTSPYYERYANPGPALGYGRQWSYGWNGEDDE